MSVDSRITALRTEVQTLVNQAKALYSELETKGEAATGEERTKFHKLVEDGQTKREELQRLEQLAKLDQDMNQPASAKAVEAPSAPAGNKTLGQQFIESKQFKERNRDTSVVAPVEVKILSESVTADGGAAVFSQRRTDIVDNARLRPRMLLSLLNVSPTTSSSIDYVAITGFTNNAAEVAEFVSGNGGLKPESDMTTALRNAPVQIIAHWIRSTRALLDDAPALRNTVDVKLLDGLEIRLEDEVLNGNGTAPNLQGILQTSGIQTRVMNATTPVGRGQTTTDTRLDTIRRAITDIYLAFYRPTGIILNPADGEALELAKDTTNNYLRVYDSAAATLWRVPVVETPAIASLTALVGDFRTGATLYMREQANIRVSEHTQDDFIRNMIRILAEMRAALAVTDAPAFEKITLI